MKSKTHTITFIFIIFLVCGFAISSFGQESEQLFQKGLMKENGEGNLQDAIGIYEEIVSDETAENAVKAKAQLHIGLCYEKLGKTEAIKAYELVLQNYKNYNEEVEVASLRLAELITDEENKDYNSINLFGKGSDVAKGTMLENSSLSPDGTKMVGIDFSVGQNVAVYDLKTKKIQLVTNYDWMSEENGWTYFPIWSPDGTEVVYMYSDWQLGNMELQISKLNGEKRTLLKKESSAQIIPRQWSKEGNSILTYVQDTSGYYTIAIVSAIDGTISPLYKTQWTGTFITGDASISPDGKFVVFSDGPEDNLDIYIIDAKGGPPSKISNSPTNEHHPLWSPDGEHLVFIKETKGEAILYALGMKNGKPDGQAFMLQQGMQNVTLNNWTKQGICYNMVIDLHDIYTLPLDPETGISTGKPEPLDYTPTGSNISPVWSPDGEYLAFITYDVKPEVAVMPLAGGDISYYPITAPGFEIVYTHDLRWLPDNSGIGLSAHDPLGNRTLYQLDLASGEWQNWSLPPNVSTHVEWGPDNHSIIYSDHSELDPGLYQLNLETNESEYLFRIEKEEDWSVFQYLKFSWDRKKLAFHMNDQKIMLYDFETGEGNLLAENYYAPLFSPDGQKIMAHSGTDMAIFSLDGEILHTFNLRNQFSKDTRIWGFDWSPDGKQLVFYTRNMKFETSLMKNVELGSNKIL